MQHPLLKLQKVARHYTTRRKLTIEEINNNPCKFIENLAHSVHVEKEKMARSLEMAPHYDDRYSNMYRAILVDNGVLNGLYTKLKYIIQVYKTLSILPTPIAREICLDILADTLVNWP